MVEQVDVSSLEPLLSIYRVSLPLTLVTLVILIEVKGKPVLLPNLFLFTLWLFETVFLYSFGPSPGTSSCRPGWP